MKWICVILLLLSIGCENQTEKKTRLAAQGTYNPNACTKCDGKGKIQHMIMMYNVPLKMMMPTYYSSKCNKCNGTGSITNNLN